MLDEDDDGDSDSDDDGIDDDFLLCLTLFYARRVQKINSYRGIGPKEIVI